MSTNIEDASSATTSSSSATASSRETSPSSTKNISATGPAAALMSLETSKTVIVNFKHTSESERGEMQRLNSQMQRYVDNVKQLEMNNKRLLNEVEQARRMYRAHAPDTADVDKTVSEARKQLETESTQCVIYEAQIEENAGLVQDMKQRMRFLHHEQELQRQRMHVLEQQLDELQQQHEHLLRHGQTAERDIAREQQHMERAEQDLKNARKMLKAHRGTNKKIEFEIQSLQDEIEFRKALYHEEMNMLRREGVAMPPHGVFSSPHALADFYKKELVTAIQQIREDFNTMKDQQLSEYKERKERELQITVQRVEQERAAQIARVKAKLLDETELLNGNELGVSLEQQRKELAELSHVSVDLATRLKQKEEDLYEMRLRREDEFNRLADECEFLKQQNQVYVGELDQWERSTRNKLELEIQTYRSILNSQLRFFQTQVITSEVIHSTRPAIKVIEKKLPEPRSRTESLNILKQMFDSFDADKTGQVDSSEFSRMVSSLSNVEISKEAYEEIMREADSDKNHKLDFNEFCFIMSPVLTGEFDEAELTYAFNKFGTESITLQELKHTLTKIRQYYSEKQMSDLIAKADVDHDGQVNFQEYSKLMRTVRNMKYEKK